MQHVCKGKTTLFTLEKQLIIIYFSYTKFLVKRINVGKILNYEKKMLFYL